MGVSGHPLSGIGIRIIEFCLLGIIFISGVNVLFGLGMYLLN